MNKITPYKSRKIDYTRPVYVYRNLNVSVKVKTYSIMQDRLVKGHATTLSLKDCQFKINKSGQKRVRKEKRKNVHSFIFGQIEQNPSHLNYFNPYQITYNPYKNDYFVASFIDNIGIRYTEVKNANRISIERDGIFAAGVN